VNTACFVETPIRRAGSGTGPSSRAGTGHVAALAARLALVLIGSLLLADCARAGDTIPVQIRGHVLHVEVAVSEAEQARGLMYRKSLPSDGGMLFVYPSPRTVHYWMRNTFIPLSIAFIGSDRRIINMADMAPNNSTRTYSSRGPCQYVLEVNQGWFKKHGVQPGDRVEFKWPPDPGPTR